MDLNSLLSEEEESEKVWLITYSDMVTLLLAFFVVIASISQVDEAKFEQIQEALHHSVSKVKFTKPITEIKEKLENIVLKEKLTDQVNVQTDPRGLVIEFRSGLLFDIGDDAMLVAGSNVITDISSALNQAARAGYTVAVEGHTDNVPISSDRFRSNWELSTARATSVVRHLMDTGIPRDHLMAAGFADIKPKVMNDTPEHRAMNRRVVIKVLG